jgi:malto-oligosyltrehalose synthase
MSVPRATMRLQFHRGFTFADAWPLAPYFAALGISHIYASPIMTARPGSMHGYDVVDPTRINPELGGEPDFRRLVEVLRRHDLDLIVDIVPNHMAIGSANPWWMDVLANGRHSHYAKFFDINWRPENPALHDKVLLPVLGRPYGDALAAGEVTVQRDAGCSGLSIRYFDHVFPVAAGAGGFLTGAAPESFDPDSEAGRERLHQLLESQNYRLAWWRSANDAINWRRFFDINELVAIRIEDDEVFEAIHAKFFRLYAEGLVDGVRVDHIDGLAQPEKYCRTLRQRLAALQAERPENRRSGRAYFVVEKILAHDESLPASWQTDGTTGYDFMDEVSALQHDPAGERPLRDLWQRASGRPGDFADEETLARRQTLQRSFAAQLDAVVQAIYDIAQTDLSSRDIARPAIWRVLTEILAHFPVYRTYARVNDASPSDNSFLRQAVAKAMTTCLPGDAWLLEIVAKWLSGTSIRPAADARQAVALARFEQLSAPLCAKAVEDTGFYRYGRLISRNDVGFDARRFSSSTPEFHRRMQARATKMPHAMLASATHDHKRGEDVRARLAVLSELAGDWAAAVERWLDLSAAYCDGDSGTAIPSAGDRTILFQTIVGAWPLGLDPADQSGIAAFAKRIAAWQQKALREAKLHTEWSAPNERYECAAHDFIARIFAGDSNVLAEIADFAARIAPAGAVNGLAQVLTKLTVPGVPDTYQGTEYWDLSLVDPDNRSPVDFAARQDSLDARTPAELVFHWADGRIKQNLIGRILALRKKRPQLFADGSYLPLEVTGPQADHVVAFARVLHDDCAITVFCRCPAGLLAGDGSLSIPTSRWSETRLVAPRKLCGGFSDIVMPGPSVAIEPEIEIGQILARLPVALLTNHSE